jgi:group II intron reverse transcriptase/maturase
MHGNSIDGNWESPRASGRDGIPERAGKAGGRTPATHGRGQSDGPIVPQKRPNKAHAPVAGAAEAAEGRGPAKGNSNQQNTPRTQRRTNDVPNALERVRQVAKRDRKVRFTALLHHVTQDRLREAYFRLKRKAAPGVDGVTWQQYGENLEANLQDLHNRLQGGRYRAKPSRRAYIPKADGRQRPLGIASLEDKIAQSAVVEVLNAIYEVDFVGFSYGFRPGRHQHQALDALTVGIHRKKVNWVLDADVRGYFDAIDHGWLVRFLEHRIADRRILRLIQKWLAAGVLEDGKRTGGTVGSPQGATISPLLANVYLHYVLDLWVNHWRKRYARGDVIVVRYADDFVVGFQYRSDAERLQTELRNRMRRFGLELHPEKTRLFEFGRFAADNRKTRGLRKPETFTFLGFTHIAGRTRRGRFQVIRRTAAKRLRAKLHELKAEMRRRMHWPIPAQGVWLRSVVRGYFTYHAVPNNFDALAAFRAQVKRHWLRTLRRRSQKNRLPWARMSVLADRWLPRPRILHPWPGERFDARTRGRSRMH